MKTVLRIASVWATFAHVNLYFRIDIYGIIPRSNFIIKTRCDKYLNHIMHRTNHDMKSYT